MRPRNFSAPCTSHDEDLGHDEDFAPRGVTEKHHMFYSRTKIYSIPSQCFLQSQDRTVHLVGRAFRLRELTMIINAGSITSKQSANIWCVFAMKGPEKWQTWQSRWHADLIRGLDTLGSKVSFRSSNLRSVLCLRCSSWADSSFWFSKCLTRLWACSCFTKTHQTSLIIILHHSAFNTIKYRIWDNHDNNG